MNKQDLVNQISDARRIAAKSPTTQNRHRLGVALSALGKHETSEEKNYEEAILLYEEAKSIYSLIGDNNSKAKAYFNLCRIYELGLHNDEMAYMCIKKALESLEDERIRPFFELELGCLKVAGIRTGWLYIDK